jgi:hypothetical protein
MSVLRLLLVLLFSAGVNHTFAQEALILVTVARAANGATTIASTPNAPLPAELARRLFPLDRRSHAFHAALPGAEGQQVLVRFNGVLLPNGLCAIADYQAFGLAAPEPGKPFGEGSTIASNRTGFSLRPGEQTARTISAQGDHGPIIYQLVFTAIKVHGAPESLKGLERSGGWF